MTQMNAKYYDGQSSIQYDAIVTFTSVYWDISYTDPSDGRLHQTKWKLEHIRNQKVSSSLHVFKHGDFPPQTLEFSQPQIMQLLRQQYPQRPFTETIHDKVLSKGFKGIAVLLACTVGIVLLFYFWILPFMAEKAAQNVPKDMEIALGEKLFEGMRQDLDIDTAASGTINAFAKNINFHTHYKVQIWVVKDSTVNAFAIPGGTIVVYTGIIQEMNDYTELSALLAHETAHVQYRHSMRSLCKSLAGSMFISLAFGDVSGITSTIIQNGNLLNNLSYSRSLEEEADHKGIEILRNNQIDLKGFVNLFNTLQKQHEEHETLGFMSTHPLTKHRLQYATLAYQQQKQTLPHPDLETLWDTLKQQSK